MRKRLLQKRLVSDVKQNSLNQSFKALAVMDNSEAFHNKNIVVAENVGFRLEADLFKSAPMILCLAVIDITEMFHNKEQVVANKNRFQI